MKKLNKKGFTMVELIIVIVIIGVLAAVLIPTFAGIIRKSNDSAYQQERTNQMIQDAIAKVEKVDKYMSWEDLEEAIAKALAEKGDNDDLAKQIIAIIKDKDSTGLTSEQLSAILEAIANKKLSDIQVKVILEGINGIDNTQIADIIAKLPQTGITKEDIAAAVKEVLGNDGDLAAKIDAAVTAAIANIPTLNEAAIAAIVEQILKIGEQLLGIRTVRINNTESIDVMLPVETSDGSLDLEDIKNSTLVPFEFKFAGGASFIAPESINEEWNNATADFVISFNKDIEPIISFNYNYNNTQHTANSENYKILPVIPVGKFGNNATSFWERYKNMWLPCPITSDGYKANKEMAL